jgi:hypothetical protein
MVTPPVVSTQYVVPLDISHFSMVSIILMPVQCADIQFSASATSSEPSSCKNGTGVTAIAFTGAAAQRNANESTAEGQAQSGSGSSSGSSGSSGTATSTGGAVPLQTAAWGVLGAAMAGGLAIL